MERREYSILSPNDSTKIRFWHYCVLFIITVAIFTPVLWRVIHIAGPEGDYTLHNLAVERMWNENAIGLPHFLYHAFVLVLVHGIGLNILFASMAVSLVAVGIVPLLVLKYLYRGPHLLILSIFSIIAALVSPITITALWEHGIYTGYIPMTLFHSPTMILLKPFALWNFLLSFRALTSKDNSIPLYVLGFVSLVLSALAEPSYMLILLPASMLFVLVRIRWNESFSIRYLLFSIIIPSISVLAWQYYFTFFSHSSYFQYVQGSGIIFAPFTAVSADSNFVLLKFFCSIIFPATVSLCFWKSLKSHPEHILAFFLFFVGTIYFYLLAEPGVYLTHHRFLWGPSIGLFLWFLTSLKLLVDEGGIPFSGSSISPIVWTCYIIFSVSFLNGIVKYLVDGGFLSRTGVGM